MGNSSLLIRVMTGKGATAKAEGENATYSGGWQWMTLRGDDGRGSLPLPEP